MIFIQCYYKLLNKVATYTVTTVWPENEKYINSNFPLPSYNFFLKLTLNAEFGYGYTCQSENAGGGKLNRSP